MSLTLTKNQSKLYDKFPILKTRKYSNSTFYGHYLEKEILMHCFDINNPFESGSIAVISQ